jgi:peptidyl-prolyl cis-trans isomerase C
MRMATCALLAIAFAGRAAEGDEALAARVNGVGIPAARFEHYFEEWLAETGKNPGAIRHPAIYKRFRREALAELLDEELLRQEAAKARVVVPRKQLDDALARAKAQFPSRDAFLRKLQHGGFTEKTYAEHVKQQLSIQLWIESEFGSGEGAAARLRERVRALRASAEVEVLAAF